MDELNELVINGVLVGSSEYRLVGASEIADLCVAEDCIPGVAGICGIGIHGGWDIEELSGSIKFLGQRVGGIDGIEDTLWDGLL